MYTKIILLVVCGVVVGVLWYVFAIEPQYDGLVQNNNPDQILLYAHRGLGNHAPDNSLEGAQIAVQEGLDGVDVDAQFSMDQEVVIFHDVSLERFTTGQGRVDEHTLQELQQYDLGVKFKDGSEFTEIYIATFEDFVQEITPDALLMVELKIAAVKDTGMEQRVVDIIQKYDVFDRVLISTFNPIVLYRLKQIDERVQTVFIFQDSGWDPERIAETKAEDRVSLPWYLQTEWSRRAIRKITKPDALSINEEVNEDTIDRLQRAGWPIFLWPLNTEVSVKWGIAKQPYGIVTDEPILVRDIYETHSLD